ncbi:MAG: flagellar assembly protein FliW [Proteobacteria bacterium]|nr:flagellar assembly protein FliW [Pseudomonadota bacterium]NBY20965.1 flagellar assembly protein FliW [bacterium]
MIVETTRFGSISVAEEDIITFSEGMLGFSKIDSYVLVERTDDSLFLWLQAVKKPSVAFPLLEPQILERSYKVELEDEDRKSLKLDTDLKGGKVFCIITIPTDPTKMTANLKAPIVINLKKRIAKQVILHSQDYPIRKSIFSELQQHCATHQRTIFPSSDATSYQAIHISEEMALPKEV